MFLDPAFKGLVESVDERETRLAVDPKGEGGGGTPPERLLERRRRNIFGNERDGTDDGIGDGAMPVKPYVLESSPKVVE